MKKFKSSSVMLQTHFYQVEQFLYLKSLLYLEATKSFPFENYSQPNHIMEMTCKAMEKNAMVIAQQICHLVQTNLDVMTARYLLFAVRSELALKLITFAAFPNDITSLTTLLYSGEKIDASPPSGWYKNECSKKKMTE